MNVLRRLARVLVGLLPTRGLSPVELLVAGLAVLVALAACRDHDGPDVIVDPGPPFGRPSVRPVAARALDDGSVVIILQRETAR